MVLLNLFYSIPKHAWGKESDTAQKLLTNIPNDTKI